MESEITTPQETRRCIELNLAGQPCGNTPVAEQDRCYIHGVYHALNDGRSTIDIPLLEDSKAILYVYSQVARALAQGAMPALNANGIIRCCRGAQRLLEEQGKRERFEERKRAKQRPERRTQSSTAAVSPQDAADQLAKHQHDQTDAVVPPNFDNSEQAGCPIAWPERSGEATQSNGSPAVEDMGASADPPQPWNVEPPLPVVPPPQFADAPEKFKDAVERVSNKRLDAMIRRDKAIRARGGRATDIYEKHGQGIRCDIRDTFSTRRQTY